GGQLPYLRLDRGGGAAGGGLLAPGQRHQVSEQFSGGVVRDQQGVADQLGQRRGDDLRDRSGGGRLTRGDLAAGLQPLLGQQLGEQLGGVTGRVARFGAVLVLVQPALLDRERSGRGHPAAGSAVVAPGGVLASAEGAGVEHQGDLLGVLLAGQRRGVGGQLAQVLLTQGHVPSPLQGDDPVLDARPGRQHLVPLVLPQHRSGGQQLQRGGRG